MAVEHAFATADLSMIVGMMKDALRIGGTSVIHASSVGDREKRVVCSMLGFLDTDGHELYQRELAVGERILFDAASALESRFLWVESDAQRDVKNNIFLTMRGHRPSVERTHQYGLYCITPKARGGEVCGRILEGERSVTAPVMRREYLEAFRLGALEARCDDERRHRHVDGRVEYSVRPKHNVNRVSSVEQRVVGVECMQFRQKSGERLRYKLVEHLVAESEASRMHNGTFSDFRGVRFGGSDEICVLQLVDALARERTAGGGQLVYRIEFDNFPRTNQGCVFWQGLQSSHWAKRVSFRDGNLPSVSHTTTPEKSLVYMLASMEPGVSEIDGVRVRRSVPLRIQAGTNVALRQLDHHGTLSHASYVERTTAERLRRLGPFGTYFMRELEERGFREQVNPVTYALQASCKGFRKN